MSRKEDTDTLFEDGIRFFFNFTASDFLLMVKVSDY
jgi:hypothetical protein